jgi:membrane-bound lytic murein transglycosylase A
MALTSLRSLVKIGFGFCLVAAASPQADAMSLRNAKLETLSFSALDGWQDDDHAAAFATFLKSCRAILNANKTIRSARPLLAGLFKACDRATSAGQLDRERARAFFENNFKPIMVMPGGQPEGFFTGYYETEVDGSRFPSDEYTVPIYAAPEETVRRKKSTVFANLDRTKIEDGALAGKDLEICYVKSPIDVFFAQIQGSTRVKLDNGKLLRLNYIASNGMPYTPVGKFLIDRGIVSKEEMSMDKIRDYMEANPEDGKALRRKNRSFVFFRETPLRADDECIGAQGVPLTAGRSLAVDKRVHVYGKRKARDQISPSAVCAGHGFGDRRTGTCRYIFRARRGDQSHCGPHQAKWAIRHAGAAERTSEQPCGGERQEYTAPETAPRTDRHRCCANEHAGGDEPPLDSAQATSLTS